MTSMHYTKIDHAGGTVACKGRVLGAASFRAQARLLCTLLAVVAAAGCGGESQPGGGGSPTTPSSVTTNRIGVMYTLAAPGSSFTYSAPVRCASLTGSCLGSARPPMSAIVSATSTTVEYELTPGRYQILVDRFRPAPGLGGVLGVSFYPVSVPPTIGLTQRPEATIFMDDVPQSYGRVDVQSCAVIASFNQNAGAMEVSIYINVGVPVVC